MSFQCDQCGFKNTEIQSAGEIQERGVKYVLNLDHQADLQRQVVKSDTAIFRVETLDIEIPRGRGRLSNVEGMLSEIAQDLRIDQDRRKEQHPDLFAKIGEIIRRLDSMKDEQSFPFSISIDDPAGNSSLEPAIGDEGGKYKRLDYSRTAEQNASLGLTSGAEAMSVMTPAQNSTIAVSEDKSLDDVDILEGETYSLPSDCPGCMKPAAMNLQMVNVPFFKQVVITAIVCEYCGYRTNEVKTGGEIPEKGRRIWLDVESSKDLGRDILKSATCRLKVPDCNLEVEPGTLGGRFTTVEGLLTQMRNDLRASIFDVDGSAAVSNDSMAPDQKLAWGSFFDQLDKAIKAEMRYTVILEDPLANSYVQSFFAPELDPQIRTEEYQRSDEEEEELGLADMRTYRNEDGEYVRESSVVNSTAVESNE